MIAAIFDAAGKLILYLDAPEDQVAANVPEGGRFEEVEIERMTRRREIEQEQERKP